MKSGNNIVQCCKCKRTRDGQDWSDTRPDPQHAVTHTYCPNCLKNAMGQLTEQVSSHGLGHIRAL